MSLSKYEKETILRFCEDPSEPLTVYTHSKAMTTRLLKLGAKLTRTGIHNGQANAWTLEMPVEWFREPKKKKQYSAEKLALLQERGRALGAKKSQKP